MNAIIDADTHIAESESMWNLIDGSMYRRRPLMVSAPQDTLYRDFNVLWLIDGNIFPKASGKGGFRLITLLVPCLDGWGVPEDQGIGLTRLAVESGVFPLYEVEDGWRYTLNVAEKTRPVRDYLKVQRRYRGLDEAAIDELQREVDEGWARLQVSACRTPAPAPRAPLPPA